MAPFGGWFFLFDGEAVGVRISIPAHASNLPRDLDARVVRANGERVVFYFPSDNSLGELTDDRQLISEIAIEGPEITRQLHCGMAVVAGAHDTVINREHFRALDRAVVEVLPFEIKRVIDAEAFTG